MKSITILFLAAAMLSGCLGPDTFDASDNVTIKESVQRILKELPEQQHEEFSKAVMYFSIGGELGFQSMLGAAFSGKSIDTEKVVSINLMVLDGLTGEQILAKYRERLKEAAEEQEKENEKARKDKAERAAVTRLQKEAEALLKDNKYEEALAKFTAMGRVSSGVESADEGIKKTAQAMNEFTEKVNYIDKIKITEFVAQRLDTYSKKDIPAVRISLKNTGNRSLDLVKVKVYFQNEEGDTIYEEDFHPVHVSSYSIGGKNKPLKAGYVAEMEQGKYYTIDSQLSEWSEGKAVAKIVDIEFSK